MATSRRTARPPSRSRRSPSPTSTSSRRTEELTAEAKKFATGRCGRSSIASWRTLRPRSPMTSRSSTARSPRSRDRRLRVFEDPEIEAVSDRVHATTSRTAAGQSSRREGCRLHVRGRACHHRRGGHVVRVHQCRQGAARDGGAPQEQRRHRELRRAARPPGGGGQAKVSDVAADVRGPRVTAGTPWPSSRRATTRWCASSPSAASTDGGRGRRSAATSPRA